MLPLEPLSFLLEQRQVPVNPVYTAFTFSPEFPFPKTQQTAPVPTGVAELQSDRLCEREGEGTDSHECCNRLFHQRNRMNGIRAVVRQVSPTPTEVCEIGWHRQLTLISKAYYAALLLDSKRSITRLNSKEWLGQTPNHRPYIITQKCKEVDEYG